MLRKLIETFQDRVELPIEIEEIRDAVVNLGFQDRVIFSAEQMDTGILKGAYYQWRESAVVYAEPVWTSLIVYPENERLEVQRLICAKEIIHICDQAIVKAQSPESVVELAKKLVGPFEGPQTDFVDIMAATDKLAQYQSLNLLFPLASRQLARQRIEKNGMDVSSIAKWTVLPIEPVRMMLDESWDRMSELLIAVGNGEVVDHS